MAVNDNFRNFILDQLSGFANFETRQMFGGLALLTEGVAFAKIKHDKFWLKADDNSRSEFLDKGMKQYRYGKDNARKLNFFETPVDIIEDRDKLHEWAKRSIEAATRNK